MYLSISLSLSLSLYTHTHTHLHLHSNGAALDSYTQHYQHLLGGGHRQRGGGHASIQPHALPGAPASPANVPAGSAGVSSPDVTAGVWAGSSSPDLVAGGLGADGADGFTTSFTTTGGTAGGATAEAFTTRIPMCTVVCSQLT